MGSQIHLDIAVTEDLIGHARRRPAQHGPHPRHQFARRERLDQIVVGTGIEAADPIGLLAARGQHDDRQIPGPGAPAQLAAHLQPGSVG